MKEQIYLPAGDKDQNTDKGSAPKGLSRPALPKGLENVKTNVIVGFRCNCGRAMPRFGGCMVIPIYAGDGYTGTKKDRWGDLRYDGKDFSADERPRMTRDDAKKAGWKGDMT